MGRDHRVGGRRRAPQARVTYQVGDRVRVIELDTAGRVVDVLDDNSPALVIVDLHGSDDRMCLMVDSIEHID
ncbi:hypothetical protein GYA93_14515 [Gordonia desulfuricans]|uniref:Uncharacterized protein n=1 Tax=Gordonia desulfuricans TaxID=89051 RepID=A0A7K3LRR4_9ACTN|nr:hypothetical protein [Gordonia desulfuricans]NDK90786.1 hypothetical protein [Gordonia desulfuricans]